jgi:signal transduction histidine kinase
MDEAGNEKRILVVDDNEDHRAIIQTQLEQVESFVPVVDVASSYEEAMSRFDAARYDVCLLDYKLGEMDGLDLLRAIKANCVPTSVIILTSQGDEEVAVEAMKAGAKDYLRKERLSTDALAASIRYVLELSEQQEKRRFAETALQQSKFDLEVQIVKRTLELSSANDQLRAEIDERKRAEAALQRRNLILETLNELSREVSSTLELNAILEMVAKRTVRALDATSAYIAELDALRGTAKVVAEYCGPEASKPEKVSNLGRTYNLENDFGDPAEWLYSDEGYWVDQADDPARDLAHMARRGSQSVLGLTLMAEGRPIGYIEVRESRRRREFTHEEIETVRAIAAQASMTIRNAHLYQSLQVAYQELQEADRLKSEMIQNISHEFRTPLTYVVGYIGLLRDEDLGIGPLTDDQRKYLNTAAREAQKLTWFLKNFVAVESIEEIVESESASEDCTALLEEMVESARLTADEAGVTLSLELEADLPPVRVNKMAINQVIDNLIANAIKFTPQGGAVSVQVSLEPLEGKVYVSVSDTGIGIAEELHERIFERFYQVDGSATRRFGGLGLGLAVCKEIVEAHGERIWVESTPGQGATFTFTLPVA